jgi:presqualene diphosphate synthase
MSGGDGIGLRAQIRDRVAAAGTSFYWAMRLLPEKRRDAMYAIYAFCREVDDIADNDAPDEEKRAALDEWRREIDAVFAGTSKSSLGRLLAEDAATFHLRRADFLAIIDGMAMDAGAPIQAPSLAALDLYCDRVASAVGRLSVRAFGVQSEAADAVAFHLGRALQLTNILRDLAEDAARDRLYLPREFLDAAGIAAGAPAEVLRHPNLGLACERLAERAEDHFREARAAMARCPRRPMRPARAMGAVYHAYLTKLRQRGWSSVDEKIRLPKPMKLWLALRHGLL